MKLPTAEQLIGYIIQGCFLTIGYKLCLFAATFLPTNLPTGG